MNSEHPSTERLQRSFDGDLPRSEADALRAHVAACAQCQRQLDAFSRVGELMRVSAEHEAAQVDFSNLFSKIETGLDSEARAVVTPLRAATRPASSTRLKHLYRAAPALGAVALAAAALLMVYKPDGSGELDDTPYEAVTTTAHSEVVDVDFGPNAGTVFDISLSDGASVPVVWIDDDDDEQE
jgi:hypothetical protein